MIAKAVKVVCKGRDCKRTEIHARGMCQTCYTRWARSTKKKTTTTLYIDRESNATPETRAQFELKSCQKVAGCLLTSRTILNKRNYPVISIGGRGSARRNINLRRFIIRHFCKQELARDDIIRNTCGNSTCINPKHFEITGRSAVITSPLTHDDIRQIRKRYNAGGVRQSDLAVEYGMTRTNISRIVNFDTWVRV